MKKIIFILFFFPLIGFGQSSIGIKVGATHSNLYNYSENKIHIGPNVGLVYARTFKHFQLTVEPSFNQKGWVDDITIIDINGNPSRTEKGTVKLNYLDLPITFGWIPFNGKFILGINSGLVPSLILSGKYKSSNYTYNEPWLRTFNLDFIVSVKAGTTIGEKIYLTFNLRYGAQLFGFNTNKGSGKCNYLIPFVEIGRKF